MIRAGSERRLGRSGRAALAGLLVAGTALAIADLFTFIFFVAYAAVGALLIMRRPANAIGWITLAIAFGYIGTTVPADLDLATLEAGTASTRDFLIVWVASWAGNASYVLYLALAILFPSGDLPRGRWRWPAVTAIAAGAVLTALAAIAPTFDLILSGGVSTVTIPNHLAVLPSLPIWSLIPTSGYMTLPVVVLLGVGVGALFVRYMRATGIARLQLRWLVSALVFAVTAVAFGLGALAVFGDEAGRLAWLPAIVAVPTVPLAIGVAVTRYRLYDIDRIISRTIGWATVTGLIVAAFVGTVLGVQTLLSGITQSQTLPVAASTLVAFALFQPLRRRVQSAVDRRFDRTRYDGERVVAHFSERLRDELDLATLAAEVDRVAIETVRPTKTAVWLRVPSRDSARPKAP